MIPELLWIWCGTVSPPGGHWQHCLRTESAETVGFTSIGSTLVGRITSPSGGSLICFWDTIRYISVTEKKQCQCKFSIQIIEINVYIQPVKIFWNAVSTFVESKADVSIKLSPLRSANDLASSVGTARKCLKSLLLPTSIITIFWSAWSRNSLNHRSTFSYVKCFAIS